MGCYSSQPRKWFNVGFIISLNSQSVKHWFHLNFLAHKKHGFLWTADIVYILLNPTLHKIIYCISVPDWKIWWDLSNHKISVDLTESVPQSHMITKAETILFLYRYHLNAWQNSFKYMTNKNINWSDSKKACFRSTAGGISSTWPANWSPMK